MTRRLQILLAAGMTAAALVSGCGGDDPPGDEAAAPQATASPAGTATDTPAAAATATAGDGAAKVTPLGTTLKVGQPAVIDYTDASTNKKSIIEVTPRSIETGTLDDFKNIDLDEDQKSSTPFYATIEVRNVGKGDLTGGDPATFINGVDDRGQDQNEIIFFGDFERCDSEKPKSLKPGERYEACLVYLMPGGGAITGFRWVAYDEKTNKSDLIWE